MKIKELQTLLDAQPSVSGSTFLVGTLYAISWILTVGFLILGIGLLLEAASDFKIFLNWVIRQLNLALNDDQRKGIAGSLGTLSLILSVIFAGVIFLSKMVLKRNNFIIQIEDWIYDNLSDIKRTLKKSTKK